MPIYQAQHSQLGTLLTRCTHNATLLVPDLQRPYVWSPDQVIRLLDSLLKGWPFGTLLLWNLGSVAQNQTLIPSRPFWEVVDRTAPIGYSGTCFSAAQTPGDFTMVLDGQQRLQSLLLAFSSQAAGMKLFDHEWKGSLAGKYSRKSAHWVFGGIYIDLDAINANTIESEFGGAELRPDVDFQDVIVWAFNSAQLNSVSSGSTDHNFVLNDVAKAPGRFIGLNRVWSICVGFSNQPQTNKFRIALNFLAQQGVIVAAGNPLLAGFVSFVAKMSDVYDQRVEYLELAPFVNSGYSKNDEYSDAVVNIFTRLNSGGRLLTREEITFAWIKRAWATHTRTVGPADKAIAEFSRKCADTDPKLVLSADEVVKILSFIWTVFDRQGVLVRDRDLLDGETVQNMARWLAKNMANIQIGLQRLLDHLGREGISFGEAYRSLNAFSVLLACSVGHQLLTAGGLAPLVPDQLRIEIDVNGFNGFVKNNGLRWLIASQWAGEWEKRTETTMAVYADLLAKTWLVITKSINSQLLNHQTWSDALVQHLVNNLIPKVQYYIYNLSVNHRSRVGNYKQALWLWNRLCPVRSKQASSVLLAPGNDKMQTIEVDHIVPFARWGVVLAGLGINEIGNCMLLQKNFNISKNADHLDVWLGKVNSTPNYWGHWKTSLGINPGLSSPTDPQAVNLAINARTKKIKDDLQAYFLSSSQCTGSAHSLLPSAL